jgi:2-haloacid dehalogenase
MTQDLRIDTVVFDLGGVLIDWNPRHLYRKLFGSDVEGMERFLEDVCSPAWNERQDAGRSWEDAAEEAIALHPDKSDLIKAYRARWEEMLGGPMLETVDILEELRANDVRLLALTNWSQETFPIALERYPFLKWFEGILVSGIEKMVKPDPGIYQLLISRFDVDPTRSVFIDDNLRNVEASIRSGLPAFQFIRAQELRRDLLSLGLPIHP